MFLSSNRSWTSFFSRRLIARLLSTVLCATFVVLRPFSKYGGSSAFLALTVKELAFSVQGNLAQQLETTVLHLAGGLVGIGLSALGNYFASLCRPDSVGARSTLAIFLSGICFGGMFVHFAMLALYFISNAL